MCIIIVCLKTKTYYIKFNIKLTVRELVRLGSWTKYFPLSELGGKSPVTAYLRASIIVVFPVPFGPRISVIGRVNVIKPASFSLLKLRMPWIFSLFNFDILLKMRRTYQYSSDSWLVGYFLVRFAVFFAGFAWFRAILYIVWFEKTCADSSWMGEIQDVYSPELRQFLVSTERQISKLKFVQLKLNIIINN